jgi:hypothetical protein
VSTSNAPSVAACAPRSTAASASVNEPSNYSYCASRTRARPRSNCACTCATKARNGSYIDLSSAPISSIIVATGYPFCLCLAT